MDLKQKLVLFALVIFSAYAGVATARKKKGGSVWSLEAVLYALIAAIITTLLLEALRIFPR